MNTEKKADINLYCDESCHLLHDHISIMGFGTVFLPSDLVRQHSLAIRNLKIRHNCRGELKWTKVSIKNIDFYIDLVDYFFSHDEMGFRSLIVHNKDRLNHDVFNQNSHDLFYYKMYYELIKKIADYHPNQQYKIYLDIKDTRGSVRVHKLEDVFYNTYGHTDRISNIQEIRSHESHFVQLADFLLGAVMYANRKLSSNPAKIAIVKRLQESSGYPLNRTTEPWEPKFNLFHFYPREVVPYNESYPS